MRQEPARRRFFTATGQNAAQDRGRTGKVVWQARLPAGGQANPMSYEADSRRCIVIAAGGHAGLGTRSGDYVQAYALPDKP